MIDEQIQAIAAALYGSAKEYAEISEQEWDRAEACAMIGGALTSLEVVFFSNGISNRLEDVPVSHKYSEVLEIHQENDANWTGFRIVVLPDGSHTSELMTDTAWNAQFMEFWENH